MSTANSFFKNIGIAVILNIAVKPASLLLENSVQDHLGHKLWGEYSAAIALCFLAGILADLGIGAYTTEQYASNPEELRKHFPHLWGIKLSLILIFPFIIAGFSWIKGDSPQEILFLFAVALITSLTQASEFLRFCIRALQVFKIDSYLSILEKTLYVLGIGGLLYAGITIESFIILRILIWAISLGVVYYFLVKLIGFHLPKIHLPNLFTTLGGSISFSLLTVLASINEKIDQVLLKEMINETETGLYAGAYRWLDAAFMYLWIVLPFFYARFAFLKNEPEAQQKLLERGQLITALPLVFISAFVFFYPEQLLFLFKHSQPEELDKMSKCLQIIFLGCAISSIFTVFDNLMTSTGYTKLVNWVLVICIIQNVILNVIFIPQYGAIASAYATVASYLTMALSYIYIVEKYLPVQFPYRQLFKILFLSGIAYASFYLFQQLGFVWWANIGVSAVIYAGLILYLALIPKEILQKIPFFK